MLLLPAVKMNALWLFLNKGGIPFVYPHGTYLILSMGITKQRPRIFGEVYITHNGDHSSRDVRRRATQAHGLQPQTCFGGLAGLRKLKYNPAYSNNLYSMSEPKVITIWVVVKIMVPFWIPIIVRHVMFLGCPKRDLFFDNRPYEPTDQPGHPQPPSSLSTQALYIRGTPPSSICLRGILGKTLCEPQHVAGVWGLRLRAYNVV